MKPRPLRAAILRSPRYGRATVVAASSTSDAEIKMEPLNVKSTSNVGKPFEIAGSANGASVNHCLSSLAADLVELSGNMMVETVRAKADQIVTPAEAQLLRKISRKIAKVHADIDDNLASVEARDD